MRCGPAWVAVLVASVAGAITVADAPAGRSAVVPCARGDALREVEEFAAARKEYVRILKADPTSRCARDGFAALKTATSKPVQSSTQKCIRARDLAANGQEDEAKKIYVALLTEGSSACARNGLRALAPQGFRHRWAERLKTAGTLLTTFVVPLLIAVLVMTLLFAALTWWQWFRNKARWVPLLGRPLRPRLVIGDFPSDDGTNVTAFARAALSRMRREVESGREYRLDSVSGVEGLDAKLGKLGDLAPQFKSLAAVLAFGLSVARLPRYTLGGTLQTAGSEDPKLKGITLALENRGAVQSGETLWAPSPTKDTRVLEYLGFVAAGWADLRVRQTEGLERPPFTVSARSYGFMRAGYELESRGETNAAYNAYQLSLVFDHANVGSRMNMARLAAMAGNYAEATALLEPAHARLENERP